MNPDFLQMINFYFTDLGKSKITLLIFFSLFFYFCQAQQRDIDSTLSILHNHLKAAFKVLPLRMATEAQMQSPYLIVSLLQGFYWFDSGLQSFLRSRGWPTLTHSQSMVMMNIVTGATRPVEIARNLGISRQAVHVTLAQIAELGMIRLQDDPTDRRTKIDPCAGVAPTA